MFESFPIGVVIDGQTIHCPGWMFVLAAALRGFPWALAEVEKPEFEDVVKRWRLARMFEEDGLIERKG